MSRNFLSGYADADQIEMMSGSVLAEVIRQLKDIAKRFAVDLCLGYPEMDGDQRYNSACYISARGKCWPTTANAYCPVLRKIAV